MNVRWVWERDFFMNQKAKEERIDKLKRDVKNKIIYNFSYALLWPHCSASVCFREEKLCIKFECWIIHFWLSPKRAFGNLQEERPFDSLLNRDEEMLSHNSHRGSWRVGFVLSKMQSRVSVDMFSLIIDDHVRCIFEFNCVINSTASFNVSQAQKVFYFCLFEAVCVYQFHCPVEWAHSRLSFDINRFSNNKQTAGIA